MELRNIRYFIAVAETKSLTAAASKLYVAQPALSQSIKHLEQELGSKLFIRSRKGMSLSDSGRVFLDHAYGLIKQLEAACASVIDIKENPSGVVCIAMPASVSSIITAPLYRRLTQEYPNIVLQHDEGLVGNLRRSFDAGNLDLMIDTAPERLDTVHADTLYREELYLVSKYQGEYNNTIKFKQLDQYPLFTLNAKHGMGRVIDQYQHQYAIQLNRLPHQIGLHAVIQLACSGLGHVILPWSAIHQQAADKALRAQRIISPELHRAVSILTPASKPRTHACNKVIQLIKEVTRDVHQQGQWRGEVLC